MKGGDYSEVSTLEKVLHPDFRMMSHNFMGNVGVAILNKQQYLQNVSTGVFGGVPRKIRVEALDVSGNLAMVKLRLESAKDHFVSYNSLVVENGDWTIIANVASVTAK